MRFRKLLPAAGIAIAIAIVAALGSSSGIAATPSSGTIGPTTTSVTWQSPFYPAAATGISTANGSTGTNPCPPPSADPLSLVCDQFMLTVNVAPSYWDTHSGGVQIKIEWPNNGVDRWVKMATSLTGTLRFAYGTGGVTGTGTTADAQSNYTQDGTIRIIVPRSGLNVQPGGQLSLFLVRIRTESNLGPALTPDNMPDNLSPTGAYTVKGNENCTVPQPDLTLTANDIGFYQVSGNTAYITAIVHNVGTKDASSVPVRFEVDGVQIAQPTIQTIAAGSFARAQAAWDLRGGAKKGTHTVTVTADPANAIAELDESNNSASKALAIK